MIKAVIFDFYGVLADRGEASFRKIYLSKDPQKNRRAQELNDELGRGHLGYDDFISELAKLGGVDRSRVLAYTEDYQPNRELLDFIRNDLKAKYKLGIISNAGADWVLKILGRGYYELFDDVILSYKVGLIKPEPEIYEMAARNLGARAENCVFIDDISTYCHGAEAVGMSSVWYQGFTGFRKELEAILAAGTDN